MSPVPKIKGSKSFSNRIRTHPRVDQYWPEQNDSNPCVWYVRDQLLMPVSTYTRNRKAIDNAIANLGVKTAPLMTLFSGRLKDLNPKLDVQVVELTTKTNKPVPNGTVPAAVSRLRKGVLKNQVRHVTPNHVLVPAWNGDGCPYGPPREFLGGANVPPPPAAAQPVGPFKPTITLIDSGYIGSVYRQKHKWGVDPLSQLLGHSQADPRQAWWPGNTPGSWYPCPPDVPDARYPNGTPQRLDALAGHANFVAGVLALRSYLPTLNIWNHNGSYVADQTLAHVTTEIAVLRSLLESQQVHKTQIIMLTFAFPALEDVLSVSWDSTMSQLKALNPNFVLVAPVGNQGTSQRRYPAAMATVDPAPTYPGKLGASSANLAYNNVIGVASLNVNGGKSIFTNKGENGASGAVPDPWVTCSAIGEDVPSSFLEVNLPPEDTPWPGMPTGGHDFAGNHSLALWQGTCFAAPKIAAAIANELHSNTDSALTAWQNAITKHGPTPDPNKELGYIFTDLG